MNHNQLRTVAIVRSPRASKVSHESVPKKHVRFININARSIVNKINQLEALLLSHNPHIVVITETWLHSNIRDEDLVPPAYKIFRKDRSTRGGGVAVLIKSDIPATRLPEVVDNECVCVRLYLFGCSFVLYTVYRPPNAEPDCLTNLQAHMLAYLNQKVIIAGDFNYPETDWSKLKSQSDPIGSNVLFDIMLDHNVAQVVEHPTHIFDLVFLPRTITDYNVFVEPGISDHEMVHVSFSVQNRSAKPAHAHQTVKDFLRADDTSVVDYLEHNFCDFRGDDVTLLWDKFKQLCFYCIEKFIPSKVKKPTKGTPWMTRSIIHLKRKAKRLRQKTAAPGILSQVRASLSKLKAFTLTLPCLTSLMKVLRSSATLLENVNPLSIKFQ